MLGEAGLENLKLLLPVPLSTKLLEWVYHSDRSAPLAPPSAPEPWLRGFSWGGEGEAGHKQRALNVSPEERTSFATECREVLV